MLTFLLTPKSFVFTGVSATFNRCQQEHSKNFSIVFWKTEITTRKSFKPHVDTCVVSVPINSRQGQKQTSLCRAQERKEIDDYGKMMNKKQRETHLQRKSGRQYMLSAIISMKMQRKPCKKRLTGCWLQKQAERQCNRWGQRQLELRYV